MLTTKNLTKQYELPPAWLRPIVRVATSAAVEALVDVSIEVSPGEVVGMIGPNGAGKTTLFKIISTILEPTSGSARVAGFDVTHQPREVRRRLGLVLSDDRGLYWRLTGVQNLMFFGAMVGLDRENARVRAYELLEWAGLADRDKLVFGYSAGMRSRLSIARALLADPPLLVLDEPTRSLDPNAADEVGGFLRRVASDGKAVLMSSHRLDEVAAQCDRVIALIGGRVRWVGSPSELSQKGGSVPGALAELLRGTVSEP